MLGTLSPDVVRGEGSGECRAIDDSAGYVLSTVRIAGRWVPDDLQQQVEQIAGKGAPVSPAAMTAAERAVDKRLAVLETKFPIEVLGSTSVSYTDARLCDVSTLENPKRAEMLIRPFYLRVDLVSVGRNALPVPRTATPTFFDNVPRPL